MDIGAKAKELVDELHLVGFGGFMYPDCSLGSGSTADYAYISDVISDTFCLDNEVSEYIDWARLDCDFSQMLKRHFESEGETVELIRQHESKRDKELPQAGRIIVVRMAYKEEIEIYRMVDGVVLCNQGDD